jgi:hypothetical protein
MYKHLGSMSGPKAPTGRWRGARARYLVGSVGQKNQGDRGSGCPGRCPHADRALGAGRDSPHAHRDLLRARAEVGGQAGIGSATNHLGLLPQAGTHTFEAILTQALELIFTCGHACGTIPTGLALTWGAVIALPNTLAAQEAVGEVQPLAIHRHLWAQRH